MKGCSMSKQVELEVQINKFYSLGCTRHELFKLIYVASKNLRQGSGLIWTEVIEAINNSNALGDPIGPDDKLV